MANETGIITSGGSLGVQGDPNPPIVGGALLVPGASVFARVSAPPAKTINVDAVINEPPESYCFTVPGTPPTGATVLSVWRNTTRAQAIIVRKMQAYFRTAQTTFDVNNYYRLKAVGSVSGSALLPLTAVANSFLLNNGYGAVIDQGISPTSSGALIASFPSGTGQLGCAWAFTVSQVQTLTGFSVRGISTTIFGSGGVTACPNTMRVRCSLLDVNGNILASAKSFALLGSGANSGYCAWTFPVAIAVSPGNTYYMAFDAWQDYPTLTGAAANDNNVSFQFWVPGTVVNGTDAGAALNFGNDTTGWRLFPGAIVPSSAGMTAAQATAAMAGMSWKGLMAGQVPIPGMQAVATTPNNVRQTGWFANGSPSGIATVNGDITFSIDTVGAPLATALGTDVTVEALMSVT